MYPEHKLITSGPYGYVRHPAYTGAFLNIAGVTLSHLTPGSLPAECLLGPVWSTTLWAAWWTWTAAVIRSRVIAEDEELRKRLGSDWDAYAAKVRYWFIPSLV